MVGTGFPGNFAAPCRETGCAGRDASHGILRGALRPVRISVGCYFAGERFPRVAFPEMG